jgi:hypothetical protein
MATGGRFFVTVIAPGEGELRQLQSHGLDLFQPTATVADDGRATIEGLVTLEDVGRLVHDGYTVVVEDPMEARARALTEGEGVTALFEQPEPG